MAPPDTPLSVERHEADPLELGGAETGQRPRQHPRQHQAGQDIEQEAAGEPGRTHGEGVPPEQAQNGHGAY